MSVWVTFGGNAQLADLSHRLRQAGAKDIERDMRKELAKLAAPLRRKVKAGIPAHMPSGYAPVLAGAFRTTTKVRRGAGASVTIEGYARGTKSLRQVRTLNDGSLRHPVYGRTRRTRLRGYSLNPWVAQKIPARFWSGPAESMSDETTAAAVRVLDDVAAKLARG